MVKEDLSKVLHCCLVLQNLERATVLLLAKYLEENSPKISSATKPLDSRHVISTFYS